MSLSAQNAVVTGASRGIGRAIAIELAGAGAAVALLARSQADLDNVRSEIENRGGRAVAVVCDVASSDAVDRAAAKARAELGPIDILVNNAGTVFRGSVAETSDQQWRQQLAVNLDGPFFAVRAFLDDLIARRGRIINVASIAGRQGTPMLSGYCASKHGLVGLTRALAEELRQHGIAVNAICPGSVDTEMLRRGLPGAEPAMVPEDIARTVLFLAADAPTALTGSCVDVFG